MTRKDLEETLADYTCGVASDAVLEHGQDAVDIYITRHRGNCKYAWDSQVGGVVTYHKTLENARKQAWKLVRAIMREEVHECTRQAPHICEVNGPCNGWPKGK